MNTPNRVSINAHIEAKNIIFPRFHQRDALHKILADVYENGSSYNYLIQHSAGSGKTNSIAWLAYRLSSLHDENNKIKQRENAFLLPVKYSLQASKSLSFLQLIFSLLTFSLPRMRTLEKPGARLLKMKYSLRVCFTLSNNL